VARLVRLPADAVWPERAVFKQCTGSDDPPEGVTREAWLVVGRRGGKSLILALTAVFLACFIDWLPHLAPGERGTVMVIAADRRQARVIYRYAVALLREVPMLKALIVRETAEAIDLKNGVTIETLTASFRTVRGYTLIAALCDEIAFWRSDESANPDSEIIGAIRPAMATIPGAMLVNERGRGKASQALAGELGGLVTMALACRERRVLAPVGCRRAPS
jgi:phage terminase large subunit-like protein